MNSGLRMSNIILQPIIMALLTVFGFLTKERLKIKVMEDGLIGLFGAGLTEMVVM